MKIAHLAMNHKHLNNVASIFCDVEIDEQVFYFEKLNQEKSDVPMFTSSIEQFNMFDPEDYRDVAAQLSKYNIVLVHCLTDLHTSIINEIDTRYSNIIWIGWGFDYLDVMYDSFLDVLQQKSRELYVNLRVGSETPSSHHKVSQKKIAAIKKINYFSPVLQEEFEIIQSKHHYTSHLTYIDWRYRFDCSVEKIADYTKNVTQGNKLWLGNSATITNNHADYLEIVENNEYLRAIEHYIPLSYGFDNYKESIKHRSLSLLYQNARILEDFLDFESYTKLIASCKYMVMNHVRQQGLGNVWLGLLNGCCIFLDERSPVYAYFKKHDYHIFSVEQLKLNTDPREFLLTNNQSNANKERMSYALSTAATKDRAQKLIDSVTIHD